MGTFKIDNGKIVVNSKSFELNPLRSSIVINAPETSDIQFAPGIGMHISNAAWGSLRLGPDSIWHFLDGPDGAYGSVKANKFIGPLQGNADTASAILYPGQISSESELNSFIEANKFKVAYWSGFTPAGSQISSNAIVLSGGYASNKWGF